MESVTCVHTYEAFLEQSGTKNVWGTTALYNYTAWDEDAMTSYALPIHLPSLRLLIVTKYVCVN